MVIRDRRDATWTHPGSVTWNDTIQVPFAPETKRSGVHETILFSAVWYRRELEAPELADGERLMLRFGAVDYQATVWLGDIRVGEHDCGYTPFSFDITDLVRGGHRTITVRAYDNPLDFEQPRGTGRSCRT